LVDKVGNVLAVMMISQVVRLALMTKMKLVGKRHAGTERCHWRLPTGCGEPITGRWAEGLQELVTN
jgi:hypothetical protein